MNFWMYYESWYILIKTRTFKIILIATNLSFKKELILNDKIYKEIIFNNVLKGMGMILDTIYFFVFNA